MWPVEKRRRCQCCGQEKPLHDLYDCKRCKKQYVCVACLDPSQVSECRECGVLTRQDEINRRRAKA